MPANIIEHNHVQSTQLTIPILADLARFNERVSVFKSRARIFYYAVVLSAHPCSLCGGRLSMTGPSEAACRCGATLDPTIEFQRSPCCGSGLVRRVCHYACLRCRQPVASRFLFAERIFDREYFRERMRASREHMRKCREGVRRLLASTRSAPLSPGDLPGIESVPGLAEALGQFIHSAPTAWLEALVEQDLFRLEAYREIILSAVAESCVRLLALPPVSPVRRRDVARRFITVLHMAQEGEVELTQLENDILVTKHEADAEG